MIKWTVGLRHGNAKEGDVTEIKDGWMEDDGKMMDESLGRGKVCLRRRGENSSICSVSQILTHGRMGE